MRPPVVIPSYRRAGTLCTKTLPLLLDRRVPADRITVVVADDAEHATYVEAIDRAGLPPVDVLVGVPGMGAVRNFIADRWRGPVVQIDDDLTDIRRMLDRKTTEPVLDLPALIDEAFGLAAGCGASLWGVYPVPNAYFMRPRVTTDLRYIVGAMWGAVLNGAPHQQVTLDDKEDYERTLRYYLADGAVARLDYITIVTKYYREPGGMQVERTPTRVNTSARRLVARYPELCTLNTSKKSGHVEVRLRDRRPTP